MQGYEPCEPQCSDRDCWYSCSSIWKEYCPSGSQCIPRPSLSDLPAHEQAVTLLVLSPQLKTYPLIRSLWGKPGIQSPQKFVYAVQLHSSIMCWQHLQAPVLVGDAGSPGVSLLQGRLATQKASCTHSCKLVIQDVLVYLFCSVLICTAGATSLT